MKCDTWLVTSNPLSQCGGEAVQFTVFNEGKENQCVYCRCDKHTISTNACSGLRHITEDEAIVAQTMAE
jgi:hypothetical protein